MEKASCFSLFEDWTDNYDDFGSIECGVMAEGKDK